MTPDNFHMILIVGVILLGIIATVVYYFARYFFRTSDQDKELAKSALDKPDINASLDQALGHTVEKHKVPAGFEEERKEDELTAVDQAVPAAETAPQKEELKKPAKDLRSALENTRSGLLGRIKSAFTSGQSLSSDDIESLEEILYTSDLGPQTVQRLVEAVSERLDSQEKSDVDVVRSAIKNEMLSIFSDQPLVEIDDYFQSSVAQAKPFIWMVVGVNGAGKTTTIGKLAARSAKAGLKTMVVAGDTFRAAAEDQLKVWSERANVEIFSPEGVKDPSAVAFDGLTSAKAKGFEAVIVDTAGRLHTQDNLMEELKKMKRVMQKVIPDAPHEVILVLDANSGQNALVQAKNFHEALDVTGVVLTKLDGSAKGGVAVGLAYELGLPIRLIGVGEGIEDLRPFHSQEFVDSII